VIGTQISHAAGVGIAAKIRGDDTVVMGYMGDGATSSNDFHAGLNFAAVKKAPVVFVCQNNHWAISVPVSDQMASDGIAIKAPGYGIPGIRVDGNDLLAVYKVACDAVARARGGAGPTFIECVTYRRGGHSSSDDPTRYRDDAEVAKWAARDPIDRMKAFLIDREIWSEEQEAEHDEAYLGRLNTAITAALEAEAPHPDTLFDDVYAEVPPHLADQREELRSLQEAEEDVEGAFPL
jgi:pyruvate dehydrogenase E1 component alpha subunit/2-oxoisovalerate dehydrogenase E1 component alpha subunit